MKKQVSSDLRRPDKKFRPELEGVRAVAAFLVAVYHIWLGSVSGGVDVFFIVSGYLITTSLLSKMERHGQIHYFDYVLGLGRRLFPQAFIVLFFSVVFSFLVLPQVQWKQTMSEIFASVFYFQNWQLATNAIDYLAQNNEASPLQHFWALSIQGQFYVTWPLVIFIAFIIAKKLLKTPPRKTLLGVLVTLFITSISYSIYITTVNQPWAYFDTLARVWEFSLGGILALLIPYLTFNKLLSTVLGWVGLGIIVFTGILLPVSTVFPGYAALLPTSGVILIIIAAENSTKNNVVSLLGSKPFMYFGGISYGFYLWHFPLLVFYYAYFQTDTVPIFDGIVVMLISFFLSLLSTRLLESPIRKLSVQESRGKILAIIVMFLALVLGSNTAWGLYHDSAQEEFNEQLEISDYPGARVLYDNVEATLDIEPIGTPVGEENKLPAFYQDGCYVSLDKFGFKKCSYGETDNPEFTIALVGGSHSGHWFPALMQFADEEKIQIDVYNKDACRFSTQDFDGALDETCMDWNEKIVDALLEDLPDLIFTTATTSSGTKVPEGYIEMWEKFDGVTNIFAIRDNPRMKEDVPLCVEVNGPDDCGIPREDALASTPPWEVTDGIPSNVYFADLSNYFCDEDTCQAVIGNVLVYRDRHHISTLYSQTLGEPLKEEIQKALKEFEEQDGDN
ncbi:acyltransferase family protein [Ornithinibacillus halophilus]|uniref:Peptidoglycan/LPS O-acetylase OafA/YrhL, contains acyltransferase and SGNH-hydrolase domains n=1 Tax=Ornithinibacillus halophilus TaxID=930117 RepID=A0A1M5EB63_9BACI|nr:acyltransferase family protein [Ornithinibacillus halophilus]SHF76410.1 Peptidoglycan/LPS O-acetylase OafA/YrhL, contains acyltransferase and SGNH-hydrolase domains [Ornithinibacillus halophilus]